MIFPATDPLASEAREAAHKALAAGFPVGVPTGTVYVLAVDPFAPGASDRLFELKHRPRELSIPVLVATMEQALGLVTALPENARRLMERCWPGPLTLVLPRHPDLTADLGEDDLTVGVRMPDDPVARALCREVGPLGAVTAGFPGEEELATAEDVEKMFGEAVPVVLDGGRCAGLPATVIDATGEDPHLIREGRLTWATALAAINAG